MGIAIEPKTRQTETERERKRKGETKRKTEQIIYQEFPSNAKTIACARRMFQQRDETSFTQLWSNVNNNNWSAIQFDELMSVLTPHGNIENAVHVCVRARSPIESADVYRIYLSVTIIHRGMNYNWYSITLIRMHIYESSRSANWLERNRTRVHKLLYYDYKRSSSISSFLATRSVWFSFSFFFSEL